jgi:hypothetical protein
VSVARAKSALRRAAALRELNASPLWRRVPVGRLGKAPVAVVFGNCQAEALRRILLTHPDLAAGHHLLRVPAVHEISPRELGLLQRVLPRTQVLITQEVKTDYRDLPLGTDQLVGLLPAAATVIRWPVAYFEGMFPFHVYVNRDGGAVSPPAPITDYHDLRILYAAGQGWDVATTVRWLEDLQLDPDWVRDNADASLRELATREERLQVRISDWIRDPANLTRAFHTINHPSNALVVEMARQVLDHLGYPDADRVLAGRQTYLEHLLPPREPQILRALGTEPDPSEPVDWRTSGGTFTVADVVTAHLGLYAADPQLLAAGLRKHEKRLARLSPMFAPA